MSVELALSVTTTIFIVGALVTSRRIARAKVTALLAIGAAAALAENLLAHNMFWAGVAAMGLVLLTGATAIYSREDSKTEKAEDAR